MYAITKINVGDFYKCCAVDVVLLYEVLEEVSVQECAMEQTHYFELKGNNNE